MVYATLSKGKQSRTTKVTGEVMMVCIGLNHSATTQPNYFAFSIGANWTTHVVATISKYCHVTTEIIPLKEDKLLY